MIGLRHDETAFNDRAVPYADSVAAAALTAKGIANDERGFLMTGNGRFIEEADRRVQRARASFAASAAAGARPGPPQPRAPGRAP